MDLLLLSNSKLKGFEYLEYAQEELAKFFDGIKKILFIPYAGVGFSYDEYTKKVAERFNKIDIEVKGIHKFENAKSAVNEFDAIAVGGGNTFRLLEQLYENDLIKLIRNRVRSGMKYTGWSAGSNMACPSIKTTNDMPIIEPKSFEALALIEYQINPHYTDLVMKDHFGETRDQRLEEFLELNQNMPIVGLREGTMIKVENEKHYLIGDKPAKLFRYGKETIEIQPGEINIK